MLPLGISEARLQETPESRALSSRLRKEHAGPIVLFVGRMRPYKGLPVLVDAMRSCPGTLLLVGRGEMEERVRRRVKESGIESRVVFAGDVPDSDLAGYYRAADLFVHFASEWWEIEPLATMDKDESLYPAWTDATLGPTHSTVIGGPTPGPSSPSSDDAEDELTVQRADDLVDRRRCP